MTPDEQKRLAKVAKIISEGGSVYMHPDTLAKYETTPTPSSNHFTGVPVVISRFIEPGQWIVVAKRETPSLFRIDNSDLETCELFQIAAPLDLPALRLSWPRLHPASPRMPDVL